jgi:post-segregation antitoxin (ccd killing protein)
MTTTVQISLPDQLAQQARAAGILNDQAMERIIKMELKRRAGEQLLESVRKISAVDGAAPSAEEIQAEIDAYRAERRAKSG